MIKMFEALFKKKTVANISPREVMERLNTNTEILLLDVRTPEEYAQAHIPHSISLPLNQLKSGISKIVEDKSAEIIVYCLSGMRAAQACSQLTSMGYSNVRNLGGIQSWKFGTERS